MTPVALAPEPAALDAPAVLAVVITTSPDGPPEEHASVSGAKTHTQHVFVECIGQTV